MTGPDDFYVGYRRRAPAALAGFLRRAAIGLLALGAAVAALLASAQKRFGPGVFEYGSERELTGVIAERPLPHLAVPRPGAAPGSAGLSRYPLAARGKRGAADAVAGLDGAVARAAGTLVHRSGITMLELAPGAPRRVETGAGAPAAGAVDLGVHTLRGEIVDAKCWLGVMKPNRRQPHRACAELCLRGGLPAALVVADRGGGEAVLLLAGAGGGPAGPGLVAAGLVAEPVEVTGRVTRHGDLLVLEADPAAYRRLPRPGAREPDDRRR